MGLARTTDLLYPASTLGRTRTYNFSVRNRVLYPLSYEGMVNLLQARRFRTIDPRTGN